MSFQSSSATLVATALSHAATHAPTKMHASALLAAANLLLPTLERGEALGANALRSAMSLAFGEDDGDGNWLWKDAYEACETAQLLFLRRYLPTMRSHAPGPGQLLAMVSRIASLTPTHTRRSEESVALQQFSTPIELGLIASIAAGLSSDDVVLEPSAGTGLLTIFAESAGATLVLNEIARTRADLLSLLYPDASVTRFNAEHIHDLLPAALQPTAILMNPPFSAALNVHGATRGTDLRHVRSALMRLTPGGRLVAITGAHALPETIPGIDALGRILFTVPIAGSLYRRHGTTIETRLTVIDRLPVDTPAPKIISYPMAMSAAHLLELVTTHVPPRTSPPVPVPSASAPVPRTQAPAKITAPRFGPRPARSEPDVAAVALDYVCREPAAGTATQLRDNLYEPYRVESLHIPGAAPHPTKLVQSAAMAAVHPPQPTYRPHLPANVVSNGLLSDAQLESVIYAGEAHSRHLAGHWTVNETLDVVSAAHEDDLAAVRFRRGWFLGDGTGAGKGRQVAGILLDNWLKGRRRAVWISKSDKLIADAQRDWSALDQEKLQIIPLARFRQGEPIPLAEGILFTTYATLRSPERGGKPARLQQIIDWLGAGFDGVIVFDESHAMGNAAGGGSERGQRAPSQQGLAGLRLQHALPDARIVYVSATGATTVENLAYAQRLGLWGGDDFPFANRAEFVAAMHEGGIAAMEVLARDLKALGLYAARSLSYVGVEVDFLEHQLTPAQIAIYDAYAGAFQIIHHNLDAALKASGITSHTGTLNRQAKAAARSAFESNKQRFFNHLITAMKMPSLIAAIEADLASGRAAIVQLVSTSEALMERRLAEIPAGEWGDLSFDVTPKEYVLNYLAHGFPTQLFESYTDSEGNLLSRPVIVDGQPMQSREAEALRDAMIEHLAALPPVQGALDQLIQHFGTDKVAEVTGRSRRIVKKLRHGQSVLAVENRPASANLAEAQAFMDDDKRILVFSDAGGTGRSYHADLAARNQRQRVHYLLEAGWKADTAIQGLGRSNRTNQAQPPLFRPVATDVRGEKRFLSTIARRLDSLGAITRGQRQTGGQGLFRAEDNLESRYARAALRQLFIQIHHGSLPCCSLERFTQATGLELADADGGLRDELPPITTFLNRLLALEIGLQNALFEHFDALHTAQIESALAAGTFEIGLETIRAESLRIVTRSTIATHAATGADTRLYEVERKDRNEPLSLEAARAIAATTRGAKLLVNSKSSRTAVQIPAPSLSLDDGTIEQRVRLVRPMERTALACTALEDSHWKPADAAHFDELWQHELSLIPEFTTSRFHIVTGLLLPVWKQLPFDNPRVYRFVTDDDERIIGRLIPAAYVARFRSDSLPDLSPDQAWQLIVDGGAIELGNGLALKRVSVMHAKRIELTGFNAAEVPLLKALGLTSEIINWRTRLFVPLTYDGTRIVADLISRHRIINAIPADHLSAANH